MNKRTIIKAMVEGIHGNGWGVIGIGGNWGNAAEPVMRCVKRAMRKDENLMRDALGVLEYLLAWNRGVLTNDDIKVIERLIKRLS